MASSSWSEYGPTVPTPSQGSVNDPPLSSSADRPRRVQSRQLLSCTKCRERKVKCDRMKPCSACCARGNPKECEFVVSEGNDYSPIQQSYEIRNLRRENQRLKKSLQAARHPLFGDDDDDDGIAGGSKTTRTSTRAANARQRRFKSSERVDNLYFGTPGLASIVHDFAHLQMGIESLTHTVPKPHDMYVFDDDSHKTIYPFSTLWSGSREAIISSLLGCLPPQDELFAILESFQQRAQACSFPHTPDDLTEKEVHRFLADAEGNADKYPEMLALILAALASGLQFGQYDRSGGQWVAEDMAAMKSKADVYLAAGMQALRMGSFMSQPTLLSIESLIIIGPYLTNSGRFLDAWTLFGTTIRLAHSMGLHRHPRFLEHAPPQRECMIRQTLWWWMLHLDQQYSVTLGRPLGISGMGDCPPPEPLTTNPTTLRLGEFVHHFTILARQILSSDGLMSVTRIDEFTDKLVGLWDTMPVSLQFNESWLQEDATLPEWPLDAMSATLYAKVQSFLSLLSRQRFERTQSPSGTLPSSPKTAAVPPHRPSVSSETGFKPTSHAAPLRGRPLVISSCIALLQVFLFFHHRNSAVLISWTIGQQAFHACMILILDAWETENEQNEWLVNQAFAVFAELEAKGVHRLAALAVQRISDVLVQLGNRKAERERQVLKANDTGHGQQQQQQPPQLIIDAANLMDWSGDTVMGNTGMFLLEDPGYQSFVQPAFQPLGWNMAGTSGSALSAHPSQPSHPPTSIPSPAVPVSQVAAAPFPVVSPPFIPTTVPVTHSPYAVGLQPRMPLPPRRRPSLRQTPYQMREPTTTTGNPELFAPVNPFGDPSTQPQLKHETSQHSFSLLRDPRSASHPSQPVLGSRRRNSNDGSSGARNNGAGVGSRRATAPTTYRLDRPAPRGYQRRK